MRNSLTKTTLALAMLSVWSGASAKLITVGDGRFDIDTSTGEAKFAGIVTPGVKDYEVPSEIRDGWYSYTVTEIKGSGFSNNETIETVKIPSTVTKIGSYSFQDCTSLKSVQIPSSVTFIGDAAFYNCSSLTSIDLPRYVEFLGFRLFSDCTSLTDVTFPDAMPYIESEMFRNCTSLTAIEIPSSVSVIMYSAFKGCTSLTSINIPSTVKEIQHDVFSECTALESVVMGNGVTEIPENAFYGCTSLKTLKIGESVETIGNTAFYCCQSLTSLTIPDSVKEIAADAFAGCSGVTSIELGSSLTSIGANMFTSMPNLSSITFKGALKEIGDYAFFECKNLKEINLPESLERIGEYAFWECEGLEEVVIPDAVTEISSYAFANCTALKSLTLGKSVATIGMSAFYGCPGLTELTIPESVRTIGMDAFMGVGITTLELPDGVTSLGGQAFSNCTQLISAKIGNSLAEIPAGLFWGCHNLATVTWGSGVTYLGGNSFRDCFSLKEVYSYAPVPPEGGGDVFLGAFSKMTVYIPEGSAEAYADALYAPIFGKFRYIGQVDEVDGDYLFRRKPDGTAEITGLATKGLKNIKIPSEVTLDGVKYPVTSIGLSAFQFEEIDGVEIPESVTSIETMAFMAAGLGYPLTLTGNIKSIGILAFAENGIGGLNIKGGPTVIGRKAFDEGVRGTVEIENVERIESETFHLCRNLENVKLGPGVKYIGENAFKWCGNLESVTFGESVEYIDYTAFDKCSSIKEFYALPTTPPEVDYRTFQEYYSTATLYVDSSTYEDYAYRYYPWSSFRNIKEIEESSVTEIAGETGEAEAEYYDLSGNRVAAGHLMPGVYVKLQNGRTEKVLVK